MKDELKDLIQKLVEIQALFKQKVGIKNIYSNSKYFEILIADCLNHKLLPGFSGSRDAIDEVGECEYKHYKESSSNHTWTFNDFSDATIEKLNGCHMVYFCHIDDIGDKPVFDWYYPVDGREMSKYLSKATLSIRNTRKMINVGPSQIEKVLGIKRKMVSDTQSKHFYTKYLDDIFETASKIERIVGTKGILTSNKLWEILVSIYTGQKVLSEQKKHDAVDKDGRFYEYKVSQNYSWNFEDITEAVLNKFLEEKAVILAIVDKEQMSVEKIFSTNPQKVVARLKEKLKERDVRFTKRNLTVRRLQVSLSANDLKKVDAVEIYPVARKETEAAPQVV